jgi:AcrR family transcriptional regulator
MTAAPTDLAEIADARFVRSRERLHAAVLELAAERSLAGLTVTSIADRAGVHRSTFYEHAANPGQLLQAALAVDLDALRERHLRGVDAEHLPDALRAVTRGVFAHVDERAAIYSRLDDVGGVALQSFLSGHFLESNRMLLRQGALVMDDLTATQRQAAARFVADGVVGVIAAWLEGPEPRDPEAALALLGRLLPPWWPLG